MYLQLKDVHKAFGKKVAVNRLSLDVPRGVLYGMIGPNGAGKTTTIRMIMDIIAPDSGEILFDGRPVDGSFRNRVGYLPEERGLYKKMTVREVILYMAELKGMSPKESSALVTPWLKKMELNGLEESKVEELSKGMAQKLQFITTVLHGPDIIILDELFSGLDPVNMELLKTVLMDLKKEGKTILFSTHVMEQAEKLCDYVCMISKGHKVLDGSMSQVKGQFGRNNVQMVIEGDGGFVRSLPGVEGMTEFNNYVEVHYSKDADPTAILRAAVEKVNVHRFEIMEPSLYDIFIEQAKVDPSELHEEGGRHV